MSKHLQHEIDKLKKYLLSLSALVDESVSQAVMAIEKKDEALAHKVIEADDAIDQREVDVEEECLKILALHQPVAVDLRFIVAVMKIDSDLERIGDLSVNIAERAVFLAKQPLPDLAFNFKEMATKTQEMLRESIDALINLDPALAHQVCADDDAVDNLNREIYDKVKEAVHTHPAHVNALIHLLSASRHLERIADHATNIAEDVVYMIEGEIIRHRTEEYQK